MSAVTQEPLLLCEQDDQEPRAIRAFGGELLLFSRRCPGKAVNEDALALIPYGADGLLVVADGMGGQNAARRASRIALETLAARLAQGAGTEEPLRHALFDGIEAANRAVLRLGLGAGTTLAAVALSGGRARAIHVGDSMVLHVGQRGRIKVQTVSHSPTGYAVEAGLLNEEDALQHEERHLVSNFVGLEGMRIEMGAAWPVAGGGPLLVASDGLADNMTMDEMVAIVRKGPLDAAAARLVALASERMRAPQECAPHKPDDLTLLLYRPAREGK